MRLSIDDHSLGAGNAPFWLRDQSADLASSRLFLDRPWAAPDGKTRVNLSLADVLSCAAAYRQMYRTLDIERGDVVVLHLSTPIDVYLHWVALAAEGAIAAPVNPNLSHDVVTEYGRRIGATGILAAGAANDLLDRERARLWWHAAPIDDLRPPVAVTLHSGFAADHPAYSHSGDDVVLICHTSGTTGVPKAVSATHQGFMAGIRSELSQPQSPLLGSTMLTALPAAHLSSLSTITWALLSGTKLVLASDQSAQAIVDAAARFKPDSITSFSCTLRDVSRLDLPVGALASVGLWMTTGDASRRRDIAVVSSLGTHPVAHQGSVSRAPGMFVLDCFGSSELGHMHFCMLHTPGRTQDARCIGRPAGFVTAAILDQHGNELPEDSIGYLAVQSDSITSGYWNDPGRTAACRRGQFWLTGDVGYRDRFGRYFHLDRQSDVIETDRGRIYSVRSEEELLRTIPQIERCAVLAQREVNGGLRAVCFIETHAHDQSAAVAWHQAVNAALMSASLLPVAETIVARVGTLPLGPTGKIRKFLAREQLPVAASA